MDQVEPRDYFLEREGKVGEYRTEHEEIKSKGVKFIQRRIFYLYAIGLYSPSHIRKYPSVCAYNTVLGG